MKSITCGSFVCLFVFVSLTSYAEPEIKGSPSELAQYLSGMPASVFITGEAETKIPADRAVMSIKVTTENKSLQEALRSNQELRTKLISTLGKAGIPADRIQAAKFSSTPKFGIFSEKAKSYRIENVVKVSVGDEKEFQTVAGVIDGFSELQFSGAEFEHTNKEALKQKVVSDACENALERKKLYEEKLGVSLL